MTTVDACITAKAAEGLVDKGKAKTLADKYRQDIDDLVAEGVSLKEAERAVAMNLVNLVERDRLRRKRAAIIQAAKQRQIAEEIEAAVANGVKPEAALYAKFSMDPREVITGIADLDSRVRSVRGFLQSSFVDFLDKFRSKYAGLYRDTAGLSDVVRELFGENTGNTAAKQMAGGLKQAQDTGRARFNAAGGDVVEREDFGITMRHDQSRVAAVDKEEWVNFVLDRADRKKMIDQAGRAMSERQLRVALGRAYDSIASGGIADLAYSPGPGLHRSSVNARAQSRFIAFKDADTWMEYHNRFGDGTIYNHIVGTFDKMARDIATLEVLGPYPEATFRFMEEQLDRAAGVTAIDRSGSAAIQAAEKIGSPKARLRALYETTTGRTALVANGPVARFSQGNRNIVTAAALGSAFISALGDLPLLAITSRMNGIPATRVLARHLKLFATGGRADRRLAARAGFTAQGWADKAIAAQRILGESVGPELTERIADTVLRATWLSPWTESGRFAFQLEMLGHITDQTGRTFDELDSATRNTFVRYGIDEADWDIMRETPVWRDDETGAELLRAEDIAGGEWGTKRADAANKLQQAIFNETGFAIITTNPRVKAALTASQPAGTFWGEVMRNTALFKGFVITIMHQHFSRIIAQKGIRKKAEYAAFLFIAMSSIGAIGEQMNHIASGRDPADMDPSTPEGRAFWASAVVRGGSLGLFGDITFQDANRWGGGLFNGLLGPVAGQFEDFYKLSFGNLQELAADKNTNAGRELSKIIQTNTPGRSAWFGKLAFERLIFDQLDYLLDPNADEAFSRVEQYARERSGNDYFWRPGSTAPDRLPR